MAQKRNRPGRPPGHPRVVNITYGTVHESYESAAQELRKRGHRGAHRGKVSMCCRGAQQTHHGCRFTFEK